MAAAGDYAAGNGAETSEEILDAYVARLLQDVDGRKPLAIAWDAGNGAAGEALVKLVAGLPGRHVLLNEVIDGTFPAHHPDPTVEKNLAQLKDAVRAEACDLGIAFDGDGDRIGIIDGQGRVLWGDQLLAILARDVLAANPGATIIADVKTSQVFFDEITRMGGKPMMWKTGHSHIKSKMAEIGRPPGGRDERPYLFQGPVLRLRRCAVCGGAAVECPEFDRRDLGRSVGCHAENGQHAGNPLRLCGHA